MAKTEKGVKDPIKVDTPLEDYINFMEILKPLDTLMGGTRAMRAAKTEYLPQEKEEDTNDYNTRLSRTYLVNYFKNTISKLAGEVFSKPIVIPEEMPEDLEPIIENVDNNGDDITQFALKGFRKALHQGIGFILVDYPQVTLKTEGGVKFFLDSDNLWKPWTKANEKKQGLRPNWVRIDAQQIIGWRVESINGRETLTQIRIFEIVQEPDGDYGQKDVKQIRVFTPHTWELHQETEGGEYELVNQGTNNLGYIPLVVSYIGEKVKPLIVSPPLEGLADLNIAHWQSTSDQRNILHYARLVVYFGSGIGDEITFGPNKFVTTDEPDAKLQVVEHSGHAIGAGRQDIQDLENQMSMYGLTYLMPRTGSITATEKAIDKSENDSALKSWALTWQSAINQALKITADYINIENKDDLPEATMNLDFRTFMADVEAKILIDAQAKGIIPRSLVIEELQRRGIIKEDTDLIELESELEKERQEGFDAAGGSMLNSLIARRNTADNQAGNTEDDKSMDTE
jgi:hypothetical protein